MSRLEDWPALGGEWDRSLSIEYEHGVWGKVHGARSDFRWIARSPRFAATQADAHRELNLGQEDKPSSGVYWRSIGFDCFAVHSYRSRARDSAGRADFLEKQVLHWRRPSGFPAVIGMIHLLPEVARLGDEVWWDRRDDPSWENRGFSQELKPESLPPRGSEELEDELLTGLVELKGSLKNPESLAWLYEQILRECTPALLTGLIESLAPRTLAAALLPLPREYVDGVSAAGWLPSARIDLEDIGSRWAIVGLPDEAAPQGSRLSDTNKPGPRALQLSEAAFSFDPFKIPREPASPAIIAPSTPARGPLRRDPDGAAGRKQRLLPLGLRLSLPPPPSQSGAFMNEIHDFASDVLRRWLTPEILRRRLDKEFLIDPVSTEARDMLSSWTRRVEREKPDYADRAQWQAKVDLMRALSLVAAPSERIARAVLEHEETVVPPLLFVSIASHQAAAGVAGLGAAVVSRLIDLSMREGPLQMRMRKGLQDWRKRLEGKPEQILYLLNDRLGGLHPLRYQR